MCILYKVICILGSKPTLVVSFIHFPVQHYHHQYLVLERCESGCTQFFFACIRFRPSTFYDVPFSLFPTNRRDLTNSQNLCAPSWDIKITNLVGKNNISKMERNLKDCYGPLVERLLFHVYWTCTFIRCRQSSDSLLSKDIINVTFTCFYL